MLGLVFAIATLAPAEVEFCERNGAAIQVPDCKAAGGTIRKAEIVEMDAPATARSEPANPIADTTKAHCAAKWPDDFEMRKYCYDKQIDAAKRIIPVIVQYGGTAAPAGDRKTAMQHCFAKWHDAASGFDDFEMIEYCWNKQLEAIEGLR